MPVEKDGLLQHCKDLGVKVIAYSPLAQGILTGKYSSQSPPPGFRGSKYNRELLEKVQPLILKLRQQYGTKSRKF